MLKLSIKKSRQTTAYWWIGKRNWGDLLTPLLLDHFCDIGTTWAPFPEASLTAVGSVIEHIPNGWRGLIIGSGKLRAASEVPTDPTILALRGPLTAKGVRGDFALCDPGLLANELVRVETKKYQLGVVPHWSDEELSNDPRFAKFNPVIIDPKGDPLENIRTIGECHKIVSSSLHGIIVADSFNIPRRIEYAPRFAREGGMFKFEDYHESIKTPFTIGKLAVGNRLAIDDRRSEMYDVLRGLDV